VLLAAAISLALAVPGDAAMTPAALEGRSPAESRFLEARALLQAGKGEQALGAASGLREALPAVADRVDALEAQAAEAVGHPTRATGAWRRIREGSLVWPEARLAVARLEIAAGRPAEALESLRPLMALPAPADLSRPDPAPRALLLAGITLAGQPDGAAAARRAFVDCWAGHALSAEAKECRARLSQLPPPHDAPPSDEDQLRRAEALLDWNRNESALAEARRLGERLPPPGPSAAVACRAAGVRGKAQRKLRQYSGAADTLATVVEACDDPTLRARALYLLAVARTNVSLPDGIATYRWFARDYPESAQADDALFFAAELLSRSGGAEAAKVLLLQVVERYPQSDYRAEAMFRLAWVDRRLGALDGAVAWLERLEKEYRDSDPYEHARAEYWRGRVLSARRGTGDAAAATGAWEEVARRYPADYYGLLARARLAEQGAPVPELPRPPAPASGFRLRPGPLAADPHFQAGVQLMRLGLSKEAAEELGAADRTVLAGAPERPEPLLLLAELLDRAGDPRTAHRLLRTMGRQLLREPPEGMALRVWQVAYPPAWRGEVLRWSPAAGVPPDLLQAIMREESALDPAVVSAAGAVGLTQLMVPTAAQVARKLKLKPPTASELTDASLNIRLGASHLGDLLHRFGGSAPLAIAAYNAGETAVRGWWKARGSAPLDEFVEEIPLQETRGYVKRVLRSYAAYRMLYGRQDERPVRLPPGLPPPPVATTAGIAAPTSAGAGQGAP
jgi:soluble lytic murein transglycosylase